MKGRSRPWAAARLVENVELGCRIDEEAEVEIGVLPQEPDHGCDVAPADELVRHDDAAQPEAHRDAELVDGCHGDAPGPALELAREKLRRHGGLAVRGEEHVAVGGEIAHPGLVVGEGRFLEEGERERQVLAQHVPLPGAEVLEGPRCCVGGEALQAAVDHLGLDRGKIHHGARHRAVTLLRNSMGESMLVSGSRPAPVPRTMMVP